MRSLLRAARAVCLLLGMAAALLLAWLPAADARSCADPVEVATVLRLLSDRLGLNGTLSLDHIHLVPADPPTGGPTCEAEIEGIRDGPVIFGRKLDMVRYWEEITPNAGSQPSVAARLMPRTTPPEEVDTASTH